MFIVDMINTIITTISSSSSIVLWKSFFSNQKKYSQLSIIRVNGGDESHG
jgi:hypothetical protein